MTLYMVIITIITLGILVLAHELGHFLVAKQVGIKIHEFSIGFGTKLFGVKRDETDYNIRLLPLGGYVKMAGMEPEDSDDEHGFNRKTVGQRLAVIAMGPLMNFFLAFVFFALMYMVIGVPASMSHTTIIGDTVVGYPADSAGLKPGDKLIMIDGKSVNDWNQVVNLINAKPGKSIAIEYQRNQKHFATKITPKKENGKGFIGISPQIEMRKIGFLESIKQGIIETYQMTVLIIVSLVQMIVGKIAPDLVGPVGITQIVGHAAQMGLGYVLRIAAVLSVNLGLINLLPLPALDGGRIFFLLIEGIRRKPINPEKENFIHFVGFALLIILAVVITFKDLTRFHIM